MSFDRVVMDEINHQICVVKVDDGSDFTYRYLNQAALYELGLNEKVIGKPVKETFPNKMGEILYSYFYEVYTACQKSRVYEGSYIVSSGKRNYYEAKIIPVFNHRKECAEIAAIVKDHTLRRWFYDDAKDYWDRYNESKSQFLSLYQNNADPIISIDLNSYVTNANPATKDFLGYTSTDLINRSLYTLVQRDHVKIVTKLFIKALNGTTGGFPLEVLSKNGESMEVTLKIVPVIIGDKVIALHGILMDCTSVCK